MNERIRELAEQAGEYVNEVYTPPVRSKTPGKIWEDGHIEWHTQFNQKFAELIIRECMDLLEDYTTDVHVGGIQYNVLSADETLQKHFGVERDQVVLGSVHAAHGLQKSLVLSY